MTKKHGKPVFKKGLLGKKAEIEKFIQTSIPVRVKFPSKPPVCRSLKPTIYPQPVPPVPTQRIPSQTIAVRLPPPSGPPRKPLKLRPFKFCDLPGELRNKIYGFVFAREFYKICWADKTKKSLTYKLPKRPAYASPRLDRSVSRRRRLFDYPRRIRSNEVISQYKLSPGPAALLLTCKLVSEEASSLFYSISTFTFQNQGTFAAFLDTLSMAKKASIRSLHLKHHTAGNPFLTQYRKWKGVYDDKWDDLCLKVSDELTSLEELSIEMTINDVPMFFSPDEPWMMALLWFEDIGLKRCSLMLRSHAIVDTVLEVETDKLRRLLLGENFQEGKKGYSRWFPPPKAPRGGYKILNIRSC